MSGPSVHPILLPIETLSLLILCQLTSSFAVMIIATTTRGRNLTRNLKMGRNKLLILLTYMVKMGFYDSANFSTVILSFTWIISVNTVALHLSCYQVLTSSVRLSVFDWPTQAKRGSLPSQRRLCYHLCLVG